MAENPSVRDVTSKQSLTQGEGRLGTETLLSDETWGARETDDSEALRRLSNQSRRWKEMNVESYPHLNIF